MPRFVILEHDHPTLHWDLMLEADSVLQTWRLSDPPLAPGCVIEATALADHRLAYLEYEGPVSGNRGCVERWDAGTFEECSDSNPRHRILNVFGTRVRGTIELKCVADDHWQFTWLVADDIKAMAAHP